MDANLSLDGLLDLLRKSNVIDRDKLEAHLASHRLPEQPELALEALVEAGLLTRFQARHLLRGKSKGFVLGPYRVLRPLGRGGMGLIYLAENLTLQRRVALKLLKHTSTDKGVLERFQREARAIAALNHPNIVRAYDICSTEGMHFLVMEYVEGKSLEDMLRKRGRIPHREAVGYILQAASGLQHAHEQGIIHRDIKPANLLLDGNGRIRIVDMGLARFFEDRDDNLTERLGGAVVLGTPHYISPEQALGRLDIRSDIYSLGATLYALLIGEPPFMGKTASRILLAHQVSPIVSPHRRDPSIPPELATVVLRMLARAPNERYQTPQEVIDALTPWGTTTKNAPESATGAGADITSSTTAPSPASYQGKLVLLLTLAGVCIVLAGVLLWWALGSSRPRSEQGPVMTFPLARASLVPAEDALMPSVHSPVDRSPQGEYA